MSGFTAFEAAAVGWFELLGARAVEATVLALIALLLSRVGKIPTPVRHGLLVIALAKFLLPPVAAPWSVAPWLNPLPNGLAAAATRAFDPPIAGATSNRSTEAPAASSRPQDRGDAAPADGAVPAAGVADARTAAAALTPDTVTAAVTGAPGGPRVSPWSLLLLAQLMGATLLIVRFAAQRRRLAGVWRSSRPVHGSAPRRAVIEASRRQRLRRPPTLVATPDHFGPAAAGLIRRRIAVPATILDRLPATDLRAVVEHEVAHHRRGDLWVDLALFVASLGWWMNPVYWALARQIRRLSEECCDEAAVAVMPATTYCQSLLDVAAALDTPRPPLPTLTYGSLSHPLGRRIRRMMDRSFRPRPNLGKPALTLLVVVAAVVLPVAAVSHSIATQSRSGWSWGVDDGRIELSSGAVDRLVERGISRAFADQVRDTDDRALSPTEVRALSRHGFEVDLAGELQAWGVDEIKLSQLLYLVLVGADVDHLQSLRELGLQSVDLSDAGRLVRYDVAADWIAAWQEAGYDALSVDDLVRLRRYDVDPGYAATYLQAGYELSVDDLVRLHRYAVDEHAAKRLADAGLDDFSVDDLVRLSRYDVADQYIRDITDNGLRPITVDGLVALRRYDVSVADARAFREAGIEPSVDDLVRLSRYSVEPATAAALVALGYQPTTDDLVSLQRYGVTASWIRSLGEAIDSRFSTDELVRLKRYGVTAAFIRKLVDGGFDNLTVDRIIRLKRADS